MKRRIKLKQLISLLVKQVRAQINHGKANIVRMEGFDNPMIYKSVCEALIRDENIGKLIIKLSNGKYAEYLKESREEWNYALQYLHKGNNLVYSESRSDTYVDNSFVDFKNALTKWRNELANTKEGETALLLLLGSEAASDTGGLADTSYAITPKEVIAELRDDYSKWFSHILKNNGIEGTDSNRAIHTLYRAIFSNVNIDLVRLSNFIDSLEEVSFTSIQDLIACVCETLNNIWDIPSIIDVKSVPKSQDLAKGSLKAAKIVTDGVNFIQREDDIPSKSVIDKLEKKFLKYAQDHGIDEAAPFPSKSTVFDSYVEFKKCVIDFMLGKDLEKNRTRLLKIDFAVISKIIGTKVVGTTSPKAVLISGEPLEAIGKMAFNSMRQFREEYNCLPKKIVYQVNHILLSDCTKEHKEESYQHICNYMGGLISFINEAGIAIEDQMVSFEYDQKKDPFDMDNYSEFSDKIKCSGKWGDPCKITYIVVVSNEAKEDRYEYKWAFSPNSSWLNAFSYLGNVLNRGGDSYILPTLVVCKNIQDFLNCESEDEFYAHLNQIQEEVLFDQHRLELRKLFGESKELELFDSLCVEFKNFSIQLTQNGFFNALEELRKVVDTYTKMMDNVYYQFDAFNDVQREKLSLFINCFTIVANEDVIQSGEMREVIVPAYNPVVLEKIDAKILFIRAGLSELIARSAYKQKDFDVEVEKLVQLSSITHGMDTINYHGANYAICREMWEYYGVYYDAVSAAETISGNLYGSTIVADDEDASAMLHPSPMSNIVVRNILDYIRTFPARIDGLNVAFVAPKDMQHIVAAIHAIAKNLEKQAMAATITLEIICINSKKNSASYLRKWLDSYFNDKRYVNINTYMKNINFITKNDVDSMRFLLKEYDLCFNYDILETVGVEFEPCFGEMFDKDQIKFPMTFTPDIISATHNKYRKVCISQYQFLASKAQTQMSHVVGNPHTVRGLYKAFKKLELSEMNTKILDLSHECCKWVVCVDPAIDRHILESKENNKSKIIGFTTGEGSYGELNVTVSARKDILTDIKQMLKKRITEKFANWDNSRLQAAAMYCVDYLSRYMDGSRILKALNPYDYEIHNFLAYLLTLQMLEITKKDDKFLLRTLISLDSYKHWFEEDDRLNLDSKRPDFMLIEIPKTQENLSKDKKLHLDIKIIECKMGYKSEGHLKKAQAQIEKGIKTMSANWDPNSEGIMHRYWLNQLYRAIIFTQLDMDNTSEEYLIVRDKIYGILQENYEISWTGDIFAFWLDSNSDKPDEWDIDSDVLNQMPEIDLGSLGFHSFGQMFIQKMLLPEEKREELFEYNEISEPDDDAAMDENEEEEAEENLGEGNSIPKMSNVLIPFLIYLNDGMVHTRKDDLKWYEDYFGIKPMDKRIVYESNGHPKWETILDFSITELRSNAVIENTEHGSYMLTDFGRRLAELSGTKQAEESFRKYLERIRRQYDDTQNEVINNFSDDNIESSDFCKSMKQSEEMNVGDVTKVRLLIGEDIRTKEKYYWEFGNKSLNNRHLLINGNSGCGKTYCIQALLMEAARQGVSAVVFDYTGGFTEDKLDPIFVKQMGENIEQRVVYVEGIPINPFKKGFIKVGGKDYPEKDVSVANRIAESFKKVYSLGPQQTNQIYSAVMGGMKSHPDDMTFSIMVEELEETKAETLMGRIRPFIDLDPFVLGENFDWRQIRDCQEGKVYILQFDGYGRDIQVLLTELLLWDILNFCTQTGDENKPFILVMDEAQNLSIGEKSPSARILQEGRKFGISGWYATQFMKPQLNDDEIQRLQQAGQKLYFCPPDDGIVTVAKNIDITAQGAREWADRLKRLKKGECVTCGNMVCNGKWTKYEPRIVKITSLQERIGE